VAKTRTDTDTHGLSRTDTDGHGLPNRRRYRTTRTAKGMAMGDDGGGGVGGVGRRGSGWVGGGVAF
jgi:hypothetical protein